jgi:hypothetical protein
MIRARWWQDVRSQMKRLHNEKMGSLIKSAGGQVRDWRQPVEDFLAKTVPLPSHEEWNAFQEQEAERLRQAEEERLLQEAEIERSSERRRRLQELRQQDLLRAEAARRRRERYEAEQQRKKSEAERRRREQETERIRRSFDEAKKAPSAVARAVPIHLRKYADVLGLNWLITDEELKQAYRKGAMEHHPDRNYECQKFQEIQEAYDNSRR